MGTLVGGFLQRKEPKLAELRDPISLVHSSRMPDKLAGFEQKITPYANVWAKVSLSNIRYSEGGAGNEASDIHHEMIIRRNDNIRPNDDDYVIYDKKFWRVRAIRDLNFKHRYWILFVQEEGDVGEYQFADNTTTPQDPEAHDNPQPEPAPSRPDFPFWQ